MLSMCDSSAAMAAACRASVSLCRGLANFLSLCMLFS